MELENIKLDYEKIINGISAQFAKLIVDLETESVNDDFSRSIYDQIKTLDISVEDEQAFLKKTDLKPNSVHIVVKFGNATVNFGSSVCQISLVVWGSENKIKPVQELLSSFTSKYNLKFLQYMDYSTDNPVFAYDSNTFQIWTTPSVTSNFTASGNAFRSLYTLSGTLVIGKTMVRLGTLTYDYGSGTEEIPFLAFSDSFSNALNPQPFGNTFGFAKSETNFSTYSFSISTYNMDCHLVRDVMAIKGFRYSGLASDKASTKGPNDNFTFVFNFDNGYTNDFISNVQTEQERSAFNKRFKLKDVTTKQEISSIPTISMSFTH